MKVEFIELFVVFPCSALKSGKPVVRRLLSVFAFTLFPVIIVVIRIVLTLEAFFKPAVLVGSMVDNEIHKNLHSSFVSAVKHHFKVVKRTEFGVDIFVIGNIVSVICIGRRV